MLVKYDIVKKARTVKGLVNVIGHITLSIKIKVSQADIIESRSFYVIDTSHEILILGLPFITTHSGILKLEDLITADIDKYRNLGEVLQIKYFDLDTRYMNTLANDYENEFYLAFVHQITGDNSSIDKNKDDKSIDVPINDLNVNKLRDEILIDYKDTVTEENPINLPSETRIKHRILLRKST